MIRESRRRAVLALVSLPVWPRATRAQAPSQVRRIGFLDPLPEDSLQSRIAREALWEGLRETGWVPGRNLAIEYRSASGNPERYAALAAEMTRLDVSVIVTGGDAMIRVLKGATSTIPIVMASVGDPVGGGIVKSLARPGGNITGVSNLATGLMGKWIDLLREAAPKAVRVGVLRNLGNPSHDRFHAEAEAAAKSAGLSLVSLGYRAQDQVDETLAAGAREKLSALLVYPDPIVIGKRSVIASSALQNRWPSLFLFREEVAAGGLLSYGPSRRGNYLRAATYVDRILRGANPGELAIEQPREFDVAVNLKTARALSLTIPQSLLLRATEIIE